ncbi:MAG: Fur family transcriptional regulator [Candidatus Celaenobacter antarcticus]|nr:Fur family transcriptional regulator [Candidatus Celaenobacter antarcticus]MDP8313804.1 Fur family transcriptional regulator [Candidatus Celaenobacter antarcticus]
MIKQYIEILRQHDLKKTPKRFEILRIMQSKNTYFSPQELWRMLKQKFQKIGLPTVYRILQQFQDIGIVYSIRKEDNQLYYFLCSTQQDHHHFICRKCHKVSCVQYCDFENIKQLVEDQLQSKAETHFLQIEGLCKECRES